MHGSQKMTDDLISNVANALVASGAQAQGFDVLVCPPAPYLQTARVVIDEFASGLGFYLGAQNVSAQASGAFTGEVSLDMLSEFGCQYVLLGHSERRELYAESDAMVAEKFAACVAHESDIVPVLCIGETLQQRQAGDTEAVVARQLDAVLAVTGIAGFANAVIAYEPVWAIGTGETASPEQAQQVHAFIRGKLTALDSSIGESIRLLYGGSVKPGNAAELFAQNDIDGGLIGGAAIDAASFIGICAAAAKLSN